MASLILASRLIRNGARRNLLSQAQAAMPCRSTGSTFPTSSYSPSRCGSRMFPADFKSERHPFGIAETARLGRPLSVVLAFALVGACSLTGCTKQESSVQADRSPVSDSQDLAFPAPSSADCQPPSPKKPGSSEVDGNGLWALIGDPLPTGKATKIVWRMHGGGSFHIGARTTDGSTARLTFGPDPHASSSWQIPNTNEWATGFLFRKAGCWRVHATRDDGTAGDVYLVVPSA